MIKRLSKCIREYKKATILTPIFVSLEVILEVFIPLIMAQLINAIQLGGDHLLRQILMYGGILLLMAFMSLFFGVLSGKFCATASAGFAKNLRKDLYYKVQDFSFSNIDKFSTSSLVTRLTTDINNVQNAFMMIIRIAIRSPLMLIFALTMSFTINVKLALIFLAIVPVLALALGLIIGKAFPLFNKIFKKYDKLNNSIQENVKAMRVVKSYVREDYEKEKFDKASTEVQNDFTTANRIIALNNPIMQFCMYLTMLLLSFIGAKIIITTGSTSLSIGGLSSLITYATQILSSLMMLSMVTVMITMAVASAKRITEVLNEKSAITSPENAVMDIENGDIDFNNVDFKYSEKAEKMSLTNINLHIKSGETVGVIGGTGSGKTSLIQLISRLYDTTNGEVKVGDINVKDYNLTALRDSVAVVLQKNILFSGTIKENLRWGDLNATDEELVRVCRLAQADDFINAFPDKYDSHIEQGGTNVSGGQKQRLCIARALLKKPKVLILDDSTSAVDTKTDALIRQALKTEIPHTTKIIIAQRTASIEDADKIIVMNNGMIDAVGTHKELIQDNEIYKEVYASQNKAGESNEK